MEKIEMIDAERVLGYQMVLEAYLQQLGLEVLYMNVNDYSMVFKLCDGYCFHVFVEPNFSIENNVWVLTDLITFNKRYGTLDKVINLWKAC